MITVRCRRSRHLDRLACRVTAVTRWVLVDYTLVTRLTAVLPCVFNELTYYIIVLLATARVTTKL